MVRATTTSGSAIIFTRASPRTSLEPLSESSQATYAPPWPSRGHRQILLAIRNPCRSLTACCQVPTNPSNKLLACTADTLDNLGHPVERPRGSVIWSAEVLPDAVTRFANHDPS